MTKAIVIEYNEKDENVLLQIFQKFKVKAFPHLTDEQLEIKMEEELIRENLRQKYVVTGEWDKMSLEEKEDAALYEKMLLADRNETVDTDTFLKKLQNR
jgi:hypothetical protein